MLGFWAHVGVVAGEVPELDEGPCLLDELERGGRRERRRRGRHELSAGHVGGHVGRAGGVAGGEGDGGGLGDEGRVLGAEGRHALLVTRRRGG